LINRIVPFLFRQESSSVRPEPRAQNVMLISARSMGAG
jgi:hypothetical protein